MKFAIASFGSRGDIEPSVAIGRELLRRGHEVRMAVPPEQVEFVKATGLEAVAYGQDTRMGLDANRDVWALLFHDFWKIHQLRESWRGVWEPVLEMWGQMNSELKSVADGADVLLTGLNFEQTAANVASTTISRWPHCTSSRSGPMAKSSGACQRRWFEPA